jgi:protein-tyrosine phosphatase
LTRAGTRGARMNEITPYPLFVGHAGAGRAVKELLNQGIRAVVQLSAEEPPIATPRDLVFCRFPLEDGSGNDVDLLSLAITSVAHLVSRGVPTLVCCGAGMSRSPAVVAAALSIVEHRDPGAALKFVTQLHPADVVPGFWKDVCQVVETLQADEQSD